MTSSIGYGHYLQDQSIDHDEYLNAIEHQRELLRMVEEERLQEIQEQQQEQIQEDDNDELTTIPPSLFCQCCFEEKCCSSFESRQEERFLLRCKNKQESHNICLECVSSYMREWLRNSATTTTTTKKRRSHHDDNNDLNKTNNNGVICRIPCLCTSDKDCDSHVIISDWTNILSYDEVELVRELLMNSNKLESINSKATTNATKNSTVHSKIPPKHDNSTNTSSSTFQQQNISLRHVNEYVQSVKKRIIQRQCPNCDTILIKDSQNGCNKVICPFCETRVCYCCENAIPFDGYDHFSTTRNTYNSNDKKCPLFTNEQIDHQEDQEIVKEEIFRLAKELYHRG